MTRRLSDKATSARSEGDLVASEIGAYGFTTEMRSVLIGWGAMAICIFPLGVMGVMLGLQSNDWEAAIRTAAIGFGTTGIVASISPFVWLIAKAFLWRESVHIGPGGARVRRGLLWDRWEQSDWITVVLMAIYAVFGVGYAT